MDRNIIINTGKNWPSDRSLFGDEPVEYMPLETTWPDLLVPDVFVSKGQCRKAGYYEIPWGYSEHQIGKRRIGFYIWKPSMSPQEAEALYGDD